MVRATHVIMGGESDGGKTTELRLMHDVFDGVSIFCNHTAGYGDSYTKNIVGNRASGPEAIETAVNETLENGDWSDVRINLKKANINECLDTAIDFALEVRNQTVKSDGSSVPVQIIVDESHNADPSILSWLLSEGRDKYIKAVMATQNPQTLMNMGEGKHKLKHHLGNARYRVWVGEWSYEHKGFMDYYGFPREEMKGERFAVEVFDRQMNRLATTKTKEKYA